MANILFMAFEVPYPLDRGGRIKSYHFLKALARKNSVTLIALVRNAEQEKFLSQQFSFCENVIGIQIKISLKNKITKLLKSIPGRKPFIISLYDTPQFHQEIQNLINKEKFDIFYYDHLHMIQYRPEVVNSLHILDQHNIETVLMERITQNMKIRPEKAIAWLVWVKMRQYEPRVCRESDYIIATTDVDAAVLRRWVKEESQVQVIPIGVDTNYLKPTPRDEEENHKKTLTFIGNLSWLPNSEGVLWFYNHVFPLILKTIPDVHLNIIGDRPPGAIRAMKKNPNVSILGYVSDIRSYLSKNTILVVPLLTGSGMRVKILEGMAMGTPIVSTPIGCEGIFSQSDAQILIASEPQEFANAVIKLLTTPDLCRELSGSGRTYVVENYGWEKIYHMIDLFCEKISQSSRMEP